MKKDFVTAINNANKMYPPLFLTPVEHELQGRKILHIYVPVGTQVSRCSGRIYDRNNESDDKLDKVLENPQVIKTPVVRNGKQSTLGYLPDVWKNWN